MECLLLVVAVQLLKEGRLEAAARVLCWGDERLGGGGGGVRRGRDWGGEDRTGSGEGGNERDGVVGRGRWDGVSRADMTGGRGG